jgi:hypothetical protein
MFKFSQCQDFLHAASVQPMRLAWGILARGAAVDVGGETR